MLSDAYREGYDAAVRRFKTAAEEVPEPKPYFGQGAIESLIGRPVETAKQLSNNTAFHRGGILDPHTAFWGKGYEPPAKPLPATAFARGPREAFGKTFGHAMPWVNRYFSIGAPAMEAYHAYKGEGDPSKGRLSNVLGAVGSGLGWGFGLAGGGLLGGQLAGEGGRALGQGIGHLLGSRPEPPRQQLPPVNYNQGAPNDYPPQY